MEYEVAEHKCNWHEGKEKILKNQCQEEFQRENNTCKVYSTSKGIGVNVLSLHHLLDFPGKHLWVSFLFSLFVSLIIILFAIDFKRTSHHENCSHILWCQIIRTDILVEVLFYIIKNVFILKGSFEHSIDFILRHVLKLFGHVHLLNGIQGAQVGVFTTSFVILIFSHTMLSKIWVVSDFVFHSLHVQQKVLIE